jgi:NAD dependent epimerase/dehydratase family enzyme
MVAGEVAEVVLKGGPVRAKKILETGFGFRYEDVTSALRDLLPSVR